MSNAVVTQAAASGNTVVGTLPIAAKTNSVSVSLRVSVGVSGDVDIFTSGGVTVNNVVACEINVPHTDLYSSATNAVFEFWEPSGARGDISGAVAGMLSSLNGQGYARLAEPSALHTSLETDLASVIAGGMDASGAAPFSTYKGVENGAYTHYSNFGELALGAHAYYLFGHPAATSAIDNDLALIAHFRDNDSSTKAQVAKKLVAAIKALPDATATAIVRQVLSQDPSRASGQDNNELPPDVHQGLLFAAGDVIYLEVKINQPAITQGNNTPSTPATQMPSASSTAFPTGGAAFTLKITLS